MSGISNALDISFLEMSDPAYIIRNYRARDFDNLVRLGAEVEDMKLPFTCTSLQELVESLGLPHHFPENNLFIAEIAGEIIGYVDVMPELNIRRAVLSCFLQPKYHRRGIAEKLVRCALQRSKELKVNIAHVNIPQDSARARRLFSGLGFRFVRRFLELRLDLFEVHLPHTRDIISNFRLLRRGEEDKLARVQNRSFSNTWGFSPNTKEDIIHRTSLPNCSPEDIILLCEGDELIAYCWTKVNPGEKAASNGDKGRIYMLGVDPEYRGRGIGRQVLLAGLYLLKNKGVRIVELTVDGKNTVAHRLYRSVGFEACTNSLWYEKVLN